MLEDMLEGSKFSVFKIIALVIFFFIYLGGSFYIYNEKLSKPVWYIGTIVIGAQWLTYIILAKGIYEV